MNITSQISVNFQRPTANVVHAKQGDSLTRKVSISLFSNNERFLLSEGIAVAIRYSKPDQTKGFYDTLPDDSPAWSYDVGNNVLDITLAPQVLTVAGTVKASVMLVDGDKILSTFAFDVIVEKSENFSGESEDYFYYASLKELREDIGELSDLETNAKDSLVVAINECYGKRIIPVAAQSLNGFTYVASGDQLPTVVPGSSGAHVGKGVQIVFIPDTTNTEPEATLQINNGAAVPIRLRAKTGVATNATLPMEAGSLIRGVPYTMTFCGLYWLLDSYVPLYGGSIDEEEIQEAINNALQEAKDSGEFDGKTPVKGEDYFTEADKTEFVNDVLSALPTWEGGSY